MLIKKAVITAAGEGSRMLPLTRGIRKEMLPLCARSFENGFTLKPVVQLILEDLYYIGIRNFCFVVRAGEHMIKDYFTLKPSYMSYLKKKGRLSQDVERLYEILSDVNIQYVYQKTPRGFGDAVFKARSFVRDDDFIVHAGDGYVLNGQALFKKLIDLHERLSASATLIVRRVADPKRYGVIAGKSEMYESERLIRVERLIEKPPNPPSNLAIVAVYAFKPELMEHLSRLKPGATGEIELTDALMKLIEAGGKVYALELDDINSSWLSVGTPQSYLKALETTRLNALGSALYASQSLER
ncbi:hypothetical protein B9Q02_05645 [Candidatus Marsarchaeota G1 archaeon BE_D]|jgi:UDP-glucose pyrophosphorylase|uniref:UTP--glucose-1-phosphate uridylyltransferase n=1 Tax=Candidatus Marsarchaeota G1 archaeon BE_D TaxID=1978156 RepID=A0A2R6AGU4_9ARCH|nr:MAG: hypothetical protein B9Q02_05645 [Candidatus Marsarchaeota G1 archaeon BE_D]